MNILGVDPGQGGAVALLDERDILLVEDMPVHQIRTGKKVKLELDLPTLRSILSKVVIDHVVMEKVASRPGQGVASMFKFGYGSGSVYGLIVGLQLPCSFILPQAWQKACGCGPSSDAARQRAAQLYPSIADRLSRKRDGGRADAILIARAGLRLLQTAQPMAAE
jgi:crossover junction endodeoxyribonuclease RuvC